LVTSILPPPSGVVATALNVGSSIVLAAGIAQSVGLTGGEIFRFSGSGALFEKRARMSSHTSGVAYPYPPLRGRLQMDFKKFMDDLHRIETAPNVNSVRVENRDYPDIILWFNKLVEPNYFPRGITRIFINRKGGAAAVYVYTTSDYYPHLTLTPGGDGNPHWTTAPHTYDNDGAPDCIRELLGRYPDQTSEFHW
jgi:hypothetical protein